MGRGVDWGVGLSSDWNIDFEYLLLGSVSLGFNQSAPDMIASAVTDPSLGMVERTGMV
jgi:hypothetical protein